MQVGDPYPGTFVKGKDPDYTAIFAWRQRRLIAYENNPNLLAGAIEYYRTHHNEFIEHWCTTSDPRNAGKDDKLVNMPFVLFKRQKELNDFFVQCLALETNGLVEKCREMGATWDAAAFSVWLWRFRDGSSVGWGSRKEQLVDKLGDLDSIFEKIRVIIRMLPRVFWPKGFDATEHMPFMRIINPENGSTITGEAGDNIGRGGRKLMYFCDESAHYERPEKIAAALSETTRVLIDISSVNGLGNVFYRKRKNGTVWHPLIPMAKNKTAVFIFDWKDDPRKDEEWYRTKEQKWIDDGMEHVFRQEIDRNYASSVQGVIIKPEWVQAAIDADKKLGFDAEGPLVGSLDVADEGIDKNAEAFRKGPCLLHVDDWGDGDTGVTARRNVNTAKEFSRKFKVPYDIQYDCIGVGAGVKAETNRLKSSDLLPSTIRYVPWNAALHGKSLPFHDRRLMPKDKESPLMADYFASMKAQAWWMLAQRFRKTWQVVTGLVPADTYDPGELISIPSTLRKLEDLVEQLSQATQGLSASTMKMLVNKAPDGTRSPNLADAVVMAYWPVNLRTVVYNSKSLG